MGSMALDGILKLLFSKDDGILQNSNLILLEEKGTLPVSLCFPSGFLDPC